MIKACEIGEKNKTLKKREACEWREKSEEKIEKLLALHCAPTLAGIKPASLFTLHFSEAGEREGLRRAARALSACGITTEPLCECEKYALILVYREKLLRAAITPEAESFLEKYGYRAGGTLEEKLSTLKSRLPGRGKFPHEIGLFLGYPLEDVKGFIYSGGGPCKLCGAWKVYGDGDRAARYFERCKKCTEYFCSKLEKGWRISQLISQPLSIA